MYRKNPLWVFCTDIYICENGPTNKNGNPPVENAKTGGYPGKFHGISVTLVVDIRSYMQG